MDHDRTSHNIKFIGCILTLVVLCSTSLIVQAQETDEQIVISSEDWIDVYSAMNYANLIGIKSKFVISPEHGIILSSVLDRQKPVHLIQSSLKPTTSGYKNYLESRGLIVSNVTNSEGGKKLNLELARKIDTRKFIIVDDSYGYNAISVASYSIASRSWVLFTDRDTIDDIYTFLKERTVENLMIYGHVDRVVRERLGEFNPVIIDSGDRFEDNLAIVDKFLKSNSNSQVVLTNGEFIEEEIMSGREPVLFIGRDAVPEKVIEYVKGSNIRAGIVVGNELTGAASRLKDSTNISIFIKFAQGRQKKEGMALPESLDMFNLPRYQFTLDAISAQYNEASKQLEIIYRNDEEIGGYLRSSIEIFADGTSIATVGDENPQYIDGPGDSGNVYGIDLTNYARSQNLTAQLSTLFGESPRSLNLLLKKTLNISTISVLDSSKIEVSDLIYDIPTARLGIDIKNTGNVPSFGKPSVSLLIDGTKETVNFDNIVSIQAGKRTIAYQRIDLTKADLADNPQAQVHVNYGERPEILINKVDTTLQLNVKETGYITYVAITVIFLVLAILVVRRYKKEKAPLCLTCSASLPPGAKFCLKCGNAVKDEKNENDVK